MLKPLENNVSFNVAPNARVTINETIGQLDIAEILLQFLPFRIGKFSGVCPDPPQLVLKAYDSFFHIFSSSA